MELLALVETVATWLTYGTFFMGVPALLDIFQKQRAEPGHIIGFTMGLALCTAWYHVGFYAPNPMSSAQLIGLAINSVCMFVFLLYTDDKSLVAKHVGALLAMNVGLHIFGNHMAPSREWAQSGVFTFAILLNTVVSILPLLSINDVKKHKCTFPMGMDLKNSLLLFSLCATWGLHGLLAGEIGSVIFNGIMTSCWALVVYYNLIYPFHPPKDSKKKVPGLSLKRVTTSMKDFGDKVSNFTLEEFGGYADDKND